MSIWNQRIELQKLTVTPATATVPTELRFGPGQSESGNGGEIAFQIVA
jgi:hypothetical protein